MEKQAEKLSVKVYTLQDDQEMQIVNKEVGSEEEEEQVVKVCRQRGDQELYLLLTDAGPTEAQHLTLQDGDGVSVIQFVVSKETDCCQVGSQSLLVTVGNLSVLLQFQAHDDMQKFNRLLRGVIRRDCNDGDEDIDGVDNDEGSKDGCNEVGKREDKDGEMEITMGGESFQEAYRRHPSVFADTEDSYAPRCYQFHGCLSQQQNTLQDYMRTATYHRAILLNETDFRDKVVLNVGCGSAILSFFAVQAGAKKVYAVETSPMAKYAQVLVQNNHLSDRVVVLEGKMEDVTCPEMVDVIISEPIGYMLLSERTMESFLCARKWLRPNGLMFPSSGDIHLAPFTDEQLYIEHYTKASFWHQRCFYGINLSGLHSAAVDEFFRQPIMDTFDMQILMSRSLKYTVNFLDAKEEELRRVEIPFVFTLFQSGLVHGLAFWFDVAFQGSSATVWLSTAPSEPLTHWYQVRCLLQTPLFAKLGQTLSGTVVFTDNKRRSYDIHITAMVNESGFRSGNMLDLKNPFFRYM